MLVLVLCIVGMISPVFFGGQISRLALVRFRAWWILLAALLSQILIIEIFPDADRAFLEAVHMATYVAAGVFVAINWRIPGLLIIAAGGALNGVTIALNGGQLPASRPALQMAGIAVDKGDFVNSGVLADPVLPLLGDIFVWPEPFPFANVFSFGDVLIVLGTFYGAHKIAGSRLVKQAWVSQEEREALAEATASSHDVPVHAPTHTPARMPARMPGAAAPAADPASAGYRKRRHAAPSAALTDGV